MSRPENRTEFWDALVPLTLQDGSAFTLDNVRSVLGMTDAECGRAEELLNDGVANPRYDDISAREFVSDMLQSWLGAVMAEIYRREAAGSPPEKILALERMLDARLADKRSLDGECREGLTDLARKYISILRQYRDLKFMD